MILTIGFYLSFLTVQAQTSFVLNGVTYNSTTVTNCQGAIVTAYLAQRELTPIELAQMNYEFFDSRGYWYILGLTTSDIIGVATAYYNCHAYTFHLTEGRNNNIWINDNSPYISGSYPCFQLCSESEAIKIHYYVGLHSAVKSSHVGKYESKFGQWNVMRHLPDKVPYTYQGMRDYYKRASYISGSNTIYYSGTPYTLMNPSPGSITLEAGTGSPFSLTSTSGTSTKVVKTATYGSALLLARANGLVEAQKSLTVAYPSISGSSKIKCSSYDVRYEIPSEPGATYSWSCSGDLQFGWSSTNMVSVNAPSYEGYGYIYCKVTLNGYSEQFSIGVAIIE